MKFRRVFFSLALLFFTAISAHAQTATQLIVEGRRAYMSRDLDTARTKFQQLLETDPGNTTAIQFLRAIEIVEAKASAAGNTFDKVVLPQVEFRNATFREALDYLKQQAAKQNVAVSFVTQLPDETLAKPITLSLKNVPFTEALRYLCETSGAQYAIEKYAIVIKPLGSPAPVSDAASPSPASAQ